MPKKMTWDEIERTSNSEIESAQRFIEKEESVDRSQRWDRYRGKKLGNETKGRSQYVSHDLMDTIEWILPYMIRTFASGDPKIDLEIEGQPPAMGKALMRKIQDDLGSDDDNSIFVLFYCMFRQKNGETFVSPFRDCVSRLLLQPAMNR